jgi:hypothetical protein
MGKITKVVTRLDPTENDATAATVYISPAALTSVPADDDVVFKSDPLTFSGGSATVADDIDNVAAVGGATYQGDNNTPLNLAVNVTTTAGGTTSRFYVSVYAEVYR